MNWDNQLVQTRGQRFNAFYKPATTKGPLFIFHHGAASSASTFAVLAMDLEQSLPNSGLLAYDCRGHGKTFAEKDQGSVDLSIETLIEDFIAVTQKFDLTSAGIVLVGHSMGGTLLSKVAARKLLANVKGLVVLDAVEDYAKQSLQVMPGLVRSWPQSFDTQDQAVDWSMKSLLRNRDSAQISIPETLQKRDSKFWFRLDLLSSAPYWDSWFEGLDDAFLQAPCSRLLVLAGTGRLDKKLMVGQMQGKYQLVVLSGCNHFLHEDEPAKVAATLVDFWDRNEIKIIPKFGSWSGL